MKPIKKHMKVISIVKVICMLLSFLTYGFAHAADTVITIKANIKASPCTVEASKTVDFGTIYLTDLVAGGYTTVQETSIALTNCPSSTTGVIATFSGTPDSDNTPTSNYKNAGTATGYFINVSQKDTPANGLGNGQTWAKTIDSTTKKATYDIAVKIGRYGSGDASAIKAGTITGVIGVTFTYS